MKRVDHDRIISECTNVIQRLVFHPLSLSPEWGKAHFYRGRALYYKGEIDGVKGCFFEAASDFQQAADNRRTERHMRAIALHFRGLCCQKLGKYEWAEYYFDKAREKGFDEDPKPFFLDPIVQEVETLKNWVRQELKITEDSE